MLWCAATESRHSQKLWNYVRENHTKNVKRIVSFVNIIYLIENKSTQLALKCGQFALHTWPLLTKSSRKQHDVKNSFGYMFFYRKQHAIYSFTLFFRRCHLLMSWFNSGLVYHIYNGTPDSMLLNGNEASSLLTKIKNIGRKNLTI